MTENTLLKVSPLLFLNEEVGTLRPERRLGSCSLSFGEELGFWGKKIEDSPSS